MPNDRTMRRLRQCHATLVLWSVLLALLAGCASGEYLTVRRIPRNPLAGPLQLLSRQGPQPTDRTEQLLRRYDLVKLQKKSPRDALQKLEEEIATEPSAEKVYSYAELAYVQGRKAEALGQKEESLNLYGASVAYAYLYLFDSKYDQYRNPYDPQFRGACDLYNTALESALRIVNKSGQLRPGEVQTIQAGDQQFEVTIAARGAWNADEFERLEFVSDFELEGLKNRHHTYGLGVPLIAVRRQRPGDAATAKYYPPGLSFPVTAFLRVLPSTGAESEGATSARQCVLELFDPLTASDIQVARRLVPLETDLSTPLAYFLDNPAFKDNSSQMATLGLLDPNQTQAAKGVYMLAPYDPHKIPVVMVHGLWSSPLTWMEMFNDLRSFPELRDRYQFWFYLYPTGQPFWISAMQMREELAELRQTVDPQRQNWTMDQMVLVGHSMGGLVSRLQTIESGDEFWRIVSERPFDELEADEPARERLAETLFFKPNPSIRRVVTIGTPHRGSDFANDYTRWLGRKLITLPAMMVQTSQRLIRDNPDFFRDTELLTITTSIDSLSPDSPILPVMLRSQKPPWVRFHNVVGLVAERGLMGRLAGSGDGVVSFASAHLEDVESELVVEADHMTVHQHPRTILEVRRILREHLREIDNQTAGASGAADHAFHAEGLNPQHHRATTQPANAYQPAQAP